MNSDTGMDSSAGQWSRVNLSAFSIPLDVIVVICFVALVTLATHEVITFPDPVRAMIGLPLAFFLPGYSLLSVLFPYRNYSAVATPRLRNSIERLPIHGHSIDWRTRIALSFGVSLVLLPVLGLGLVVIGAGLAFVAVTDSLVFVIVVAMLLGWVRRLKIPKADRYQVPYRQWLSELNRATLGADNTVNAGLNVLLIILVLISAATVTYAFVAPQSGESYSQLSLLTENGQGDFIASDYPREFTLGESRSLVVAIDNYEGQTTTYTVVAELQRVETSDGSLTVLEQHQIDRFERTLAPGETLRKQRSVTPELTGENLRLVYYLYVGDAPASPSDESAYHSVYIWIDIDEP